MSKSGKEFKGVVPGEKYSEAFKRQVVKDYEAGLYTMVMLKHKYCILGHSTIGYVNTVRCLMVITLARADL